MPLESVRNVYSRGFGVKYAKELIVETGARGKTSGEPSGMKRCSRDQGVNSFRKGHYMRPNN